MQKNRNKSLLCVLAGLILSSGSVASAKSWTAQEEMDYSRFVQAVGMAKEKGLCSTTVECIKVAPGNFLRTSADAAYNFAVDCADLPYALRGYFALKRGLPFSFVSAVTPASGPNGEPAESKDNRYSKYGNVVTARKVVPKGAAINSTLTMINNSISSAMFRIHPSYDSETLPSDFYSVDIRKASGNDVRGIRPGTVIYDPAGHVAVVYKIGQSGRIFYIDAHPDNSLTRGSYGMKFVRSRPHAGAGFKNFRPIEERFLRGTRILRNNQIADFSTMQFFGNRPSQEGWSKGKFVLGTDTLEYFDYVRAVMANGNVTIDPVSEVREMTDGLCLDAKDRAIAVRGALKAGMAQKNHPAKLPANIFGTSGEWEEYSTPSRDARLKTSLKELHDSAAKWIRMYEQRSPRLEYSGSNLRADLRAAYNKAATSCKMRYTTAAGKEVAFNLNDVVDNIWNLSFSPYHCADLRWGGIGSNLNACPDADKDRWFKAQRKLRNQLERTYDTRMNYSADELLNGGGSALGTDNQTSLDVRDVLGF